MKLGRRWLSCHVCQVTEFDLDKSQQAVSMEAALVIERVVAPPDTLNVTNTALLLTCKIPLLSSTSSYALLGNNTTMPPPVI